MEKKSVILTKWRRAKMLNDKAKNPEVLKKLNRFLVTKDINQEVSLLDDAIALLEKQKRENEDKSIPLEEFKNILVKESFMKQEGKAQVIGLESSLIKNRDLYEILGVSKNDDMKNYQVFKLLTAQTEKQETKKENREGFHSIHSILSEAKYFEVPENINWMLYNTKNRVSKIRLPYIFMFFDTKFIIEDREYYGLLLGDISQLKEMGNKSEIVSHKDLESLGEGIIIQTFYKDSNRTGWVKLRLYEPEKKKHLNKLKEYVMNLIYFINSEDVKIVSYKRSEKNIQRRIQNNKVPIPTHNKIRIVGYLAKYLEKVESSGIRKGLTYRFTVRGHWRHFWNKKFDNLYKLYKEGKLNKMEGRQYSLNEGTLKVWVYPYIKGQGILIDNKYKLE